MPSHPDRVRKNYETGSDPGDETACVCASLLANPDLIPIGVAVKCPLHPERTICRGPVGDPG